MKEKSSSVSSLGIRTERRNNMTREEKIEQLERMLKALPEILSPLKISKAVPIGKNRVYELIKTKELRAFVYQDSYIIAKIDLIEYLADHWDDEGRKHYKIEKGGDNKC